MAFPSYVDIEFSARCNLACGFCFGPVDDRSVPDLAPTFWHDVIETVRDKGATGIVISGGEPTIYPHIVEMLEHAKRVGLRLVLSTHGRHKDLVLRCARFLDWIALPVDGWSALSIKTLRGDNWDIVAAELLASALRAEKPTLRLKLGTVATRPNLKEIEHLADHIFQRGTLFDTWKIYQYTPRRKFVESKDLYLIDDLEFDGLTANLREKFASHSLRVVASSNNSRRRAYLFVYPDGTLAIPNVGADFGDLVLGNLVEEGFALFDAAEEFFLPNNETNFLSTYD